MMLKLMLNLVYASDLTLFVRDLLGFSH
jgi:hypothetical protein